MAKNNNDDALIAAFLGNVLPSIMGNIAKRNKENREEIKKADISGLVKGDTGEWESGKEHTQDTINRALKALNLDVGPGEKGKIFAESFKKRQAIRSGKDISKSEDMKAYDTMSVADRIKSRMKRSGEERKKDRAEIKESGLKLGEPVNLERRKRVPMVTAIQEQEAEAERLKGSNSDIWKKIKETERAIKGNNLEGNIWLTSEAKNTKHLQGAKSILERMTTDMPGYKEAKENYDKLVKEYIAKGWAIDGNTLWSDLWKKYKSGTPDEILKNVSAEWDNYQSRGSFKLSPRSAGTN
jgi:hypothetical protein